MGSVLVVSALVTGVLALAVVASMVLENHGRIKVDLPPRPSAVTPTTAAATASDGESELEPEVSPEPVGAAGVLAPVTASSFERERPVVDELHVIEGRARADQLVATLFASYAASRGPEANRAAAWVTSVGWPPQVAGGEFRPGADLRGKPAAVARVLHCDSEGRSWLTLNTSVDIGRGLRTRPPRCPVLAGVAELWASSRAALSQLPVDSIGPMIDAITELEPQWRGTPMAPEVLSLLVALTDAVEGARSVRLQVTTAPVGRIRGRDDGAPSEDLPRGALHDAGAHASS